MTRQLRVVWTVDAVQDLMNFHETKSNMNNDILDLYQFHWVELYKTEVSFYKEILKDPFVKQGLFELEKFSNSIAPTKRYTSQSVMDWRLSHFEDAFLEPLMRKLMSSFKKRRKHKFPDGFLAADVDARWHTNNLWRMGFFSPHDRSCQRLYARCLELFFNRLLVMTEVCGRESKCLKNTSFYSELSFFHELNENLENILSEEEGDKSVRLILTRAQLFQRRRSSTLEGEFLLLKKSDAFGDTNILQLKNLPEIIGLQPVPNCRSEIEVTCNHIPDLFKIWNDAGYRRWLSVISEKDQGNG